LRLEGRIRETIAEIPGALAYNRGMLLSTLPQLRCPVCVDGPASTLALDPVPKQAGDDVLYGSLRCARCESAFPILAGVALLLDDVESYLCAHAQGISLLVPDAEIPEAYRGSYASAKAALAGSEEDLESERVNALYFLNHYAQPKGRWWRPAKGFSPEIDRLVKSCWGKGPFARLAAWTKPHEKLRALELGCGVGGLARALLPRLDSYLGVDTSFAAIALARHVNLGAPYPHAIRIPQDLYRGPLPREIPTPKPLRGKPVDFVVAELENLPVPPRTFDFVAALNVIDVIARPADLPERQRELLRDGGLAAVSSPFLWDEAVLESLREDLPETVSTSSDALIRLYERARFRVLKSAEHVPWLFLEHFRKIGFYSVHVLLLRKT
jgi:SAM-dependent methyltransferase